MSNIKKQEFCVMYSQYNIVKLVSLFKLLCSKKWIIISSPFLFAIITIQMSNVFISATTLLPVYSDTFDRIADMFGAFGEQ